jgi:HSP20 family protein
MFRKMERIFENTFKDFNFEQLEPGKSFVHGFNFSIGPNGKTKIKEFGNHSKKLEEGKTVYSDEREPLTDIIEGDDEIFVTVEIPGVEKDDIILNIEEFSLDINVNSPNRKYHKKINLPYAVIPNKSKATYKNGILDIAIKRKDKKKDNENYRVNID